MRGLHHGEQFIPARCFTKIRCDNFKINIKQTPAGEEEREVTL